MKQIEDEVFLPLTGRQADLKDSSQSKTSKISTSFCLLKIKDTQMRYTLADGLKEIDTSVCPLQVWWHVCGDRGQECDTLRLSVTTEQSMSSVSVDEFQTILSSLYLSPLWMQWSEHFYNPLIMF